MTLDWDAAAVVLKPGEPVKVASGIEVEVMLDLTELVDPIG